MQFLQAHKSKLARFGSNERHRLEARLTELADDAYDEVDAKYFRRFNKIFQDVDNLRTYIKYVQSGLEFHSNHDFYRDMMLEQRIAVIERKLGIVPAESLWLRSLKDDKVNPNKLLVMKQAMNRKYSTD